MIEPGQLRAHVIRPVLEDIGHYSPAAEELLILTAAAETSGGRYLRQLYGGPAVGIYQMEPATHDDIWAHWLAPRPGLAAKVRGWRLAPGLPGAAAEMAGNLYYATAMARIHYLRVPEPLPVAGDAAGLAAYWKAHWNTELGAGTAAGALAAYRRYGARSFLS